MNTSSQLSGDLQSAFERSTGGIVGLVDKLLRFCPEHGLQLDWHADSCWIRSLAAGSDELLALPLRKSVFRAMLARVATLCNEQIPNSVSPYGGQGELTVGANPAVVFKVTFTNTTAEQKLELSTETGSVVEASQQEVNKIVTGRVANIDGTEVIVDIGDKQQGIIPLQEWYDESVDRITPPHIGEEIQVLLDAIDESGAIVLSFRRAKSQLEWQTILAKYKEGDFVSGLVTRKIKGGLLVNIGINVFLPASQIDIRRPPDIAAYIGKTILCKILKIDEPRRNIVVSRRKLLEEGRNADMTDS